ncbi:CYTH domain-containing protein [Magnetofaba australis]|uniref:Putative adenylate cyclase n=1 Tax=Magnetofaba australis IT-1 TaxID=1434232 RepID=A0A1Y2K3R2_9PROT|nr:CYTH domain-containing protein [Magnetofaba australis]OSM01665.1 putative adenylate cyclase [Magnetofaba australis IT-1]
MALEQEIKLTAAHASILDAVRADPAIGAAQIGEAKDLSYCAIYYDTAARHLMRKRLAFRTREEAPGQWRSALKGGGRIENGVSARDEWEQFLPYLPATLGDMPAGEIRDALLARGPWPLEEPLQELLVTDFSRIAVHLRLPGCEAEMALDCGQVRANGLAHDLVEVELELLEGDFAPLDALAAELRQRHDLTPSRYSKYALGLKLMTDPGLPDEL